MSTTAEHAYTEEEQRCYDEGRAAYDDGKTVFALLFERPRRTLPLWSAWGSGFTEREAEVARATARLTLSAQA